MTSQSSEQTELLRNIWNEMKALGENLGGRIEALREDTNARFAETNQRLDQTNQRLDQTNQRLDQTNQRLGIIEGTLRDAAGQQLILGRFVRNFVDRVDDDIADLRERMGRLEAERET